MDYQISGTEPARGDFQSAIAYISQHNPAAAERLANAILAVVEDLGPHPRFGAVYSDDTGVEIRKLRAASKQDANSNEA